MSREVLRKMSDAVGERRELEQIAAEALFELQRAVSLHGPMNSAHEGYAVLLEELDELWDEIKLKEPSKSRMRTEAIQVAAMALRFVRDMCA